MAFETRLDGDTLVVRIPMQFQRRGGRKRIGAPDGSELSPASTPQPDGRLVKALARAWSWQRMLDEGLYTSISEIHDAEHLEELRSHCWRRTSSRRSSWGKRIRGAAVAGQLGGAAGTIPAKSARDEVASPWPASAGRG